MRSKTGGAKFRLAAFTGDTLNVRTDKSTEIYRAGEDAQLLSSDLHEGDKAEVVGIYQGNPKDLALKADYIFIYSSP